MPPTFRRGVAVVLSPAGEGKKGEMWFGQAVLQVQPGTITRAWGRFVVEGNLGLLRRRGLIGCMVLARDDLDPLGSFLLCRGGGRGRACRRG